MTSPLKSPESSPSSPSGAFLILKVAIPSPLRKTFDYLLPGAMTEKDNFESVCAGIRVKVPFGNRELIGLVISTSQTSDFEFDKLKPVIEIIDETPLLDKVSLELYLWASHYYQFPIGQALQTSLPKYVREGRSLKPAPQLHWRLTVDSPPDSLQRAPQQQRLFELLKTYQHFSAEEASVLLSTNANNFLKALEEKGLVESYNQTVREEAYLSPTYNSKKALPLNTDQANAFQSIKNSLQQFRPFLLEGITGSGKTEVYLQLIDQVLKEDKQALLLVPEISLTPQTLSRFEQRFNHKIVSLHSGLNDSQRFDAWLQARNGKASIIIGTRSAIFTPLPKLGLIIIDEEHDSSYKQQEGFRYSARDLAIFRAKKLNIPVVLGSATPSLESLNNALSNNYSLLQLSQRAGGAAPPKHRVLDLKGEVLQEGFSTALLEAIQHHIKQGNQALVFINRRGFAPLLQCQHCGWTATCPRCETGYTLHQHPPGLRCHHCDSQTRLLQNCPECNSSELSAIGLGTERSENVLNENFPNIPVIRIDRDSTRPKDAMEDMLSTVNSGKPCILIGTQMLAKGHHFPGVTLVAILDADSGLFSADFRGQEKMGQLMTQVAGRSGRGSNPGEVLIQTYHSDHPALIALIEDGYELFARKLLADRHKTNLPPFSYFVLFKAESNSKQLTEQFLALAKNLFQRIQHSEIVILGPMPAPMEKKAGKFRTQLILQANRRSQLHANTRQIIFELEQHPLSRKVRWSIDIDPIDFT